MRPKYSKLIFELKIYSKNRKMKLHHQTNFYFKNKFEIKKKYYGTEIT